jgi:hypothetical protein
MLWLAAPVAWGTPSDHVCFHMAPCTHAQYIHGHACATPHALPETLSSCFVTACGQMHMHGAVQRTPAGHPLHILCCLKHPQVLLLL